MRHFQTEYTTILRSDHLSTKLCIAHMYVNVKLVMKLVLLSGDMLRKLPLIIGLLNPTFPSVPAWKLCVTLVVKEEFWWYLVEV